MGILARQMEKKMVNEMDTATRLKDVVPYA